MDPNNSPDPDSINSKKDNLGINPNNPVVKLCGEGISAEMKGQATEAYNLYMKAWEIQSDDFEACIAAHYIARFQESPDDVLKWNKIALDHAELVNDDRVKDFYPSLYLNMGKANEELGNKVEAKSYYDLAGSKVADLPEGGYGDTIKDAVARGLKRIE